MITEHALKNFKEIYKNLYNKPISDQDALNLAIKLVNLYKVVLLDSKESNKELINKENNEID